MKKAMIFLLTVLILFSACACGANGTLEDQPVGTAAPTAPEEISSSAGQTEAAPAEITVTDMIGRDVTIVPGSYSRVVCIGAGALRMYSYIGDVALLAGVEDITET